MAVFEPDREKNPLMPRSESRARKLLEAQRARIHRMYPFTIRLVDKTGGDTQPRTLKIDPGSKQTGMCLFWQTHALDAVCAGNIDAITVVTGWQKPVLLIAAAGRGAYQRTRVAASGFPRGYLMRQKSIHGFQTGDMVKAVVTKGKKSGEYLGRVAVRATGSFQMRTSHGVIQGISHKDCQLLGWADGSRYSFIAQPPQKGSENGGVLGTPRYPSPAFMPGSLAERR